MNVCIIYSNTTDGQEKMERNMKQCRETYGCRWGIKLSPYYPIRGSEERCYKDRRHARTHTRITQSCKDRS